MTSVALFHVDRVHDALQAFENVIRGFVCGLHGILGHDETQHHDMFGALVGKHRTALLREERKSQIAAANILDPSQSGRIDIRYDNRLRKRNLVAVDHELVSPQFLPSPSGDRIAQIEANSIQILGTSEISWLAQRQGSARVA